MPNAAPGGDGVLTPVETSTLEILGGLAELATFDIIVNSIGLVK